MPALLDEMAIVIRVKSGSSADHSRSQVHGVLWFDCAILPENLSPHCRNVTIDWLGDDVGSVEEIPDATLLIVRSKPLVEESHLYQGEGGVDNLDSPRPRFFHPLLERRAPFRIPLEQI